MASLTSKSQNMIALYWYFFDFHWPPATWGHYCATKHRPRAVWRKKRTCPTKSHFKCLWCAFHVFSFSGFYLFNCACVLWTLRMQPLRKEKSGISILFDNKFSLTVVTNNGRIFVVLFVPKRVKRVRIVAPFFRYADFFFSFCSFFLFWNKVVEINYRNERHNFFLLLLFEWWEARWPIVNKLMIILVYTNWRESQP